MLYVLFFILILLIFIYLISMYGNSKYLRKIKKKNLIKKCTKLLYFNTTNTTNTRKLDDTTNNAT